MKLKLASCAALAVLLVGCGDQEAARAERKAADRAHIEQLVSKNTADDARAAIITLEEKYRADISEGGEFHALYEQAKKTRLEAEKQAAIAGFKARLEGQIEAVEGISTARPDSMANIRLSLAAFESGARTLADGREHTGDAEIKAGLQRLRRDLSEKQRQALPQMRAGFGKAMGQELWENDVEVTVQGAGNRTVRFIAGMFAANRNIAAGQQAAQEVTSQLRFRRTQFEWYRGSEYTYYTLDTPDDGAVGTWSGSYFNAVPAS